MRMLCALYGLFLAIAIVNCSPIVKREAEEDLSPLNEVYVVEADDDEATDGERGDRDKRKIGVKVGIGNGIINFVFDKLDSFIISKTKALETLDDSNRAKNAAFGIDPHSSASQTFINELVSQKIKAATGSIGPIINSATTLLAGASAGLQGSLISKIAPLSSLSGGLSGGAGHAAGAEHAGASVGAGSGPAAIGNLLSQTLGSLSTLSQSSGGLSGGASGGTSSGSNAGTSAGAGLNLGAFANLGGVQIGHIPTTTTTEDTPIFDRTRVSLEIPPRAFGTGFALVTNVSQILNSLILNSARRTQVLLEIFKPFFRGSFAIKGLPSDNHK